MRFRIALVVIVSLIGAAAYADAIQKWRTPDGELYFGDRPPAGSTLLETLADSPVVAPASGPTELERAAAEGREIIRRREEARADERRQEVERDAWADQVEASVEPQYESPIWIVETRPPCAPGERCFDDHPRRHHHHHDGDGHSGPWGPSGWKPPDPS